MNNKRKGTLTIFFILLLAVFFMTACESSPEESQESEDSSSNEAVEGETDEGDTVEETTEGSTTEDAAALTRTNSQGSVSVGITFLNPLEEDPAYFNFEVALNTHSVDLDGYDLSEMTTLYIDDQLQSTEGIQWTDIQGGGHHVSGILKLPKYGEDGNLSFEDADRIELIIEELDGIDSRSFVWDQSEY